MPKIVVELLKLKRVFRAEDNYKIPGIPVLQPDHAVWRCTGFDDTVPEPQPCKLNCTKSMTMVSFVNISDFEVLKWLCNHKLMDLECNRKDWRRM